MSDVQAERQKKSILQLCIAFHARAEELQKQDLGSMPIRECLSHE